MASFEIECVTQLCLVKLGNDVFKGDLYGVYQEAHRHIALRIEDVSGVISNPVAVVAVNGELLSVRLTQVHLLGVEVSKPLADVDDTLFARRNMEVMIEKYKRF
ncbi:hypothetical protein [Loigolactobacillus bifermentans]|uniref:Uncharacterized protein n=1 Tax=Loigolactobacillus bifermentans DSM 20003 TaxID=1423726 RepID=A0A0R1GXX6_9LACO|nr:hypothetical protein [Loigolactobacillus bifermentans]KRK38997.1 hypothetical protein FC07_GL002713 [Loigolactobacillus bifermentans DSM 20003]QGG59117.1 hypothetical protein LB003_00820 [Loigolactobacillus bifermentans]